MTINLHQHLKHYFNYDTFHHGQKEIIKDILQGKDVFGVLPTGSGKSLCYQLPAKILRGTTVVVSPLISLMLDQVKQLKAIQYKDVVALNSLVSWSERQHILTHLSNYSLIYVSPELLQDDHILKRFMEINISLFVVDEAHCVSQWGHEFRTDYLRLPNVIKKLGNPTVLALSATAPESIQNETINLLHLTDVCKHIYPIDRENIALIVEKVINEQEKVDKVVELLSNRHVPTIVYFMSRRKCEEFATFLTLKLSNKSIAYYHGGLDSVDRITIQQQFMNDEIDIICCTSAFGMGVNKQNIRLIIHYHLPAEIESFIQEIGRAGRDGKESVSVSFYTENDLFLPLHMIEQQLPMEKEITLFFQTLYEQFNLGNTLPEDDEQLKQLFQLPITQIRLLIYQIEKYHIKLGREIHYDKEKWKKIIKNINQFKDERLIYKQKNLNTFLNWLETEQCLRKSIYSTFQSSYTAPETQCCSNCGFSFEKWVPDELKVKQQTHLSWDDKLANLLLIGDFNETRRHY